MKRFCQLFNLGEYQVLISVSATSGECLCGQSDCGGLKFTYHIVIQTWLADNLAMLNVYLPGMSYQNQLALVQAIEEDTSRLILAELQLAAAKLQSVEQSGRNINSALFGVHQRMRA